MTIVAADVVAANAVIIAIWLMSRAHFGRPPVGMGVKVTWASCVLPELFAVIVVAVQVCWDVVGDALDGRDISRCVPLCVSLMCMHCFRLAIGSHACMMAGLSVTL